MRIVSVGTALPPHGYGQDELIASACRVWPDRATAIERLFRASRVRARHLALPLERYGCFAHFGETNANFVRVATELAEQAVVEALGRAHLRPEEVDAFFFTTVTGIAVPTIEARLMNRLPFRRDIKRVPLFGLGCVGGVAGLARVFDYLRAYPEQVVIFVSAELCSLTLQHDDGTIANLVAMALFGDGAAAVVAVGEEHPLSRFLECPRIEASRSTFYRGTERAMGWDLGPSGFRVVLDAAVPLLVRERIGGDVDGFLAAHRLRHDDIESWVCHPGGPRVLEALAETLSLDEDDLALTWESLSNHGNISSASVLFVLERTLEARRKAPGSLGILLAMGPGFCSELVLFRW